MVVEYDAHYCAYFRDHASEWRIEIPGMNTALGVSVDGKASHVAFHDGLGCVDLPKGLGKHSIMVIQ